MEDHKGSNGGWKSVPAFGEWEYQKDGAMPDYSLDFSKIREMRKQNKKELSRSSIGNEEDLNNSADSATNRRPDNNLVHSPPRRKKIMSYFNCCIIGS